MPKAQIPRILWAISLLIVMIQTVGGSHAAIKRPYEQNEDKRNSPQLIGQLGHSSSVTSVALSRDGKYLVTGSRDKTAKLWEVESGKELRTFTGHTYYVTSVALSADGKYLVTGSSGDFMAKLWEVESGKELRTFFKRSLSSVALSSDGKYLVTGNGDHTAAQLWDVESGKELRPFMGHSLYVRSVALSADGKYLVTGSDDKTAKLWDVESGKELRTFSGHSREVKSVALSGDGKYLVTGSVDKTAKLWDVESGKELHTFTGHSGVVLSVALSGDGKYLVTGSDDQTASLWEVESGRELRTFIEHPSFVTSVALSADDKYLVTGSTNGAKLWEVESGRELRIFTGYSQPADSIALSKDGKYLVTGSYDKTAKLWDVENGQELRTFTGHSGSLSSVALSPDGKYLVTGSMDKTARLWEVESGRELHTFTGHLDVLYSVVLSRDGKYLVTGGRDKTAKLWEVESGKELRTFTGHSDFVIRVALSADGKYLVTGSSDKTAKLWEVKNGKELRTFTGHSQPVVSVALSEDGKYLVTGSYDKTAKLWDVENGQELRTFSWFSWNSHPIYSVALSADSKYLVTSGEDNTTKLYEVESGRKLRIFNGHTGSIFGVALSSDGKYLVTSSRDSTIRLWNMQNGKELCRLISFRNGSSAVTDPEGRYDASNSGNVEGLHWVVGNEPIELSQLKQRYYEPGLLAKIMKGEKLRDVAAFTDPKLFPEFHYAQPAKGSTELKINLRNRGGGIGKVAVFVNGKELTADARATTRGAKISPNADSAELAVDLAASPFIKPGEENEISVFAYNQEGYLSSRGARVKWQAPGKAQKEPPELYAIIGGTSTYKSDSVNLRYSSKDAEDMAKAIRLGAKNLFGAEKVHMTVLSSSGNTDTVRPTKENFRKAFEQTRRAKPGDVLLVYLAGHGLAVRFTSESETYCYLTEEWRGSTDLKDEAIRKEQSITSDELVEWIKESPALKQIMILDTCAAGAVADKIKLVDKRLPDGDQIRAIDRLQDRTGFHVLMGAAADKASYETSQYSQGLLTYALLEGIKYAAVKNDTVEVSPWFQYARDRVPALAKNIGIGGVQQPQIMAPKGDSFPVARITGKESEAIVLAKAKPLVVRPRIINPEDAGDDELEKLVRRVLRDESEPVTRGGGGKEPRMVYLDDGELPSAVKPSGTITIEGDVIKVKLSLRRGDQRMTLDEIEGKASDKAGLATKIVEAIAKALPSMQ